MADKSIVKSLVADIMRAIPPEYMGTAELHIAIAYVYVALMDHGEIDRAKQVEYLAKVQAALLSGADIEALQELEFN